VVVVPVVYVWVFAASAVADGDDAGRLVLMAALVTAWGARLTFNFARKGGYSGVEDYRWAILRGRMSPALFQVFNLLFIVLYQMTLLVLITLPAAMARTHPAPLTAADALIAALFVGFLIGETVADQQQWDFHQAKARGARTASSRRACSPTAASELLLRAGAVVGVLRVRRDAAVASGGGVWGGVINPTIVGAILLTLLFVGSTVFTESISAAKYPPTRSTSGRPRCWCHCRAAATARVS
jgi:steroid 5-alpha reductase family enzyme